MCFTFIVLFYEWMANICTQSKLSSNEELLFLRLVCRRLLRFGWALDLLLLRPLLDLDFRLARLLGFRLDRRLFRYFFWVSSEAIVISAKDFLSSLENLLFTSSADLVSELNPSFWFQSCVGVAKALSECPPLPSILLWLLFGVLFWVLVGLSAINGWFLVSVLAGLLVSVLVGFFVWVWFCLKLVLKELHLFGDSLELSSELILQLIRNFQNFNDFLVNYKKSLFF